MTARKQILGNVILVIASLVICGLLLGVAEVLTRMFSDIPMLGVQRHLFERNKYGDTKGLAGNVKATVYGVEAYTDSLGFRVSRSDRGRAYEYDGRDMFVIHGDSVAFGNGVKEEETLAGLLKRQHPDKIIHNTSVPGNDLRDYAGFIEVLPELIPGVKTVILVYCLDDINIVSSREVERQLIESNRFETSGWIERAAISISNSSFYSVHVWLRRNSKLYLLVRDLLRDQQERYWKSIFQHYNGNPDELMAKLYPLIPIAKWLQQSGIRLNIYISPYAYQMDNMSPEVMVPQKKIIDFLEEYRIDYFDMLPDFRRVENSRDLFLPTDPMHLSPQGHRMVATIIDREQEW
jgi:hypothetical protein